ncbi:MAG: energy-coupling factor ABC transporter permease [Proteobacteria bacterium]|nr:energy-coupling factor ABC transporter permease [Pseudomonadota bacterium]
MKVKNFFIVLLALLAIFVKDSFAMHISEGILPAKEAIISFLFSLPFVIVGLYNIYRLKKENPLFMPLLGLIGAGIFVISAFPIPVPIAGTCSHPAGTGLGAIILGPFVSTVVACVSLLIQALFMAHGGITTLGANTLTMGVFGSFLGYFSYRICRKLGLNIFLSGFVAGFIADIATYGATAVILALSLSPEFIPAFKEISLAFVPTQIPLGILEGVITGYSVRYIYIHKPELMDFGRIFIKKFSLNNL